MLSDLALHFFLLLSLSWQNWVFLFYWMTIFFVCKLVRSPWKKLVCPKTLLKSIAYRKKKGMFYCIVQCLCGVSWPYNASKTSMNNQLASPLCSHITCFALKEGRRRGVAGPKKETFVCNGWLRILFTLVFCPGGGGQGRGDGGARGMFIVIAILLYLDRHRCKQIASFFFLCLVKSCV